MLKHKCNLITDTLVQYKDKTLLKKFKKFENSSKGNLTIDDNGESYPLSDTISPKILKSPKIYNVNKSPKNCFSGVYNDGNDDNTEHKYSVDVVNQ